jgi:IPT/TIG domain
MDAQPSTPASSGTIALIGSSLLLIILFLVYSLAAVWPSSPEATPGPATPSPQSATGPQTPSLSQPSAPQPPAAPQRNWDPHVYWFGAKFDNVPIELRLLLIVIIAAALSSYIHATTSFASYVGNRTLQRSWLWWYILRGPIGVALAIMFYSVVRGGLLSTGAIGTDVSPFGVAALSSMVGMFSKQATDKLRETADNLFRTAPGKGDDARADKLTPDAPTITTLVPAEGTAGTVAVVHVQGKNFTRDATVLVNGAARTTDFVSDSELVAHLDTDDTASPGTLALVVKGGPPANRQSDPATFTVRQAQ